MTDRWRFWLPRGLGIALIAFVSLFALDVFAEGYGFWETIGALVIHLVPSAILLAALALAWRWERTGGLMFVALGLLYAVLTLGRGAGAATLIIAAPTTLVGLLFVLGAGARGRMRSPS